MSLFNKEILLEIKDLLKEIKDIGIENQNVIIADINNKTNKYKLHLKHELKLFGEEEDE